MQLLPVTEIFLHNLLTADKLVYGWNETHLMQVPIKDSSTISLYNSIV